MCFYIFGPCCGPLILTPTWSLRSKRKDSSPGTTLVPEVDIEYPFASKGVQLTKFIVCGLRTIQAPRGGLRPVRLYLI